MIFESVTVGDKKEFLEKNIKALDAALDVLENERPKGKWERYCRPIAGDQHYICTCCNEYQNFGKYGDCYVKAFKFCPNCGADMRGKEE